LVGGVDPGFLPLAVGLAVEDEFVGSGLEPVDRGLSQQRVGHQGEPLNWLAVGRHDGGGGAVSLHDQLVDVGGVERVEVLQREVVDLCRGLHRSTYADPATMPRTVARCLGVGVVVAVSVSVAG
jgi:hypothetical protein